MERISKEPSKSVQPKALGQFEGLLYDVVPKHKEGPSEAEKKLAALTEQLEKELFLNEEKFDDHHLNKRDDFSTFGLNSDGNIPLNERSRYYDSNRDLKRTSITSASGSLSPRSTTSEIYSTNKVEGQLKYCAGCGNSIGYYDTVCQGSGEYYHTSCFVCATCGRSLQNKVFHNFQEKLFCEEDYLHSGFHQDVSEKCTACGHQITDQILEAAGCLYHPACFCCCICKGCLDGMSFTIDAEGNAYCVEDYHRLFAPRCAACGEVIAPVEGTEETVRVVAMDKDFHIDCYHCQDCEMQLTDEPDQRCYPLGNILLCYKCHLRRTNEGPKSASYQTSNYNI